MKTAAQLREQPPGSSLREWANEVKQAREDHFEASDQIVSKAEIEGRGLLASERREVDQHHDEMRRMDLILDRLYHHPENTVDRTGVVGPAPGRAADYQEGQPLASGQSFEGYARARGLLNEHEQEGPLSLQKYLRGMVTGDWRGAEREMNALTEGTSTAGGYLVPTLLSGQIIDLARKQTRVIQAGARIVPMENKTLDVAKWAGDPTAAWHSEGAAISPSDATLGKVTLTAQALTALTIASRELLEDADGVEGELRDAFAAQFALTYDLAALYGSGTPPEPRGVKNTAGISTASMGTNGAALTSWDTLVDAVGRLQDQNEQPTGIIYAGRTARALNKLKDTTNQPLQPPEMLSGVPRFSTNQVPTNLTQGTSSLASDVFTADWGQLLLGVRTRLQIQVLSERYADTGQIGFLCWWRGDVAVARPKAFDVLSGVL
jgi:HK97 family phage major capsid protein